MDPTTLQSTIVQMIERVAPGMGQQLYMALSMQFPQLQDKLMTTPFLYQGTATGLYERSLANSISMAAFRTMRPAMFREREDFFMGVNKLLRPYSEADYSSRAAYDAIMRSDAKGMANNPLWMMLYQTLDPTGTAAGFQALNQAGSNLIRNAYAGGNRQAFGLANVASRMFTDSQGHFKFDRRDFGSMGFDEVAQLTAALTRNMYLDPNAAAPENITKASEDLSKKVQEYAKALAPLKDVFGKDVPAMIKSIEELTDQSLGNMDPTLLRNRVNSAMSGVLTGSYSLGELVDTTKEIYGALGQMNVPSINDFSAEEQAATILGITNSGYAPATMKNARFRRAVQQNVLRTSNSRGAEYANYAYAAWKEKEENKNATVDQFFEQLNALTSGPNAISAQSAFLQMTGASDLYTLKYLGSGSSYYMDAVQRDIGGRVARQSELNRARDNYINNGVGDRATRATAWEMINQNGDLLTMSDQQLRSMDMADDIRAEIFRFRNWSGGVYEPARVQMAAKHANARAEERRGRIRSYQEMLNTLEDWEPTVQDPKEFAKRFFGLDGRKAESLKQLFGKGLAPLSPEDQKYLEDSLRMYNTASGSDIVRTNKDYTEFIRKMTTSDNATFAHYRELYNKTTNDEDRLAYSQMAMLSTVYDTDTLDRYFKGFDPGTKAFRERANKLHGQVFNPRARYEEGKADFEKAMKERGAEDIYKQIDSTYQKTESLNDVYDMLTKLQAPANLSEADQEKWNSNIEFAKSRIMSSMAADNKAGDKLLHQHFALTALSEDQGKKADEKVIKDSKLYKELQSAIQKDGVEAGLKLLNDETKMKGYDSKDVSAAEAFLNGVEGVSGAYGGQSDMSGLINELLSKLGTLFQSITELIEQNRSGGGRGGKSAEPATPAETDPSTDGGYFGGYSF